ncbi:MAG: hypothetical protein NC127_05335 [Muribaculum sp.]|nr:hypothetical protein [Muribaculum sp.]
MKIFRCLRSPGTVFAEAPGFMLYPDSAVIRDGKPFFVPSFAEHWIYRYGLAWRVCRLGKTIGARFADRYYDALSLCLFPCPEGLPDSYGAVVSSFDGAVILGEWLPLPSDGQPLNAELSDGKVIDFSSDIGEMSAVIPWISGFCTLKIGDVIVSSVAPDKFEYPIDSRVEAMLEKRPCLDFRIK